MSPNPNDPRHPWARLAAAARTVREDGDVSMPYGFATRVAALAFVQDRPGGWLFERFAFRAVGFASLLALFSVALNYEAISAPGTPSPSQLEELDLVAADDAVSIVLNLALED